MRLLTLWTCLVTVLFLWLESTQANPPDSMLQKEKKALEDDVEDEGTQEDEAVDDKEREERIFAYYTSTSITRVSTRTITAISTCLSTSMNLAPCAGRRRRRGFGDEMLIPEESDVSDLNSSLDLVNMNPEVAKKIQEDDRTGRKLTIWSTGFTTVTITSTSVRTGTTATATLLCGYPGVAQSCFLG